MKATHISTPAFKPGRHLQMFSDIIHDPYQSREKLPEPCVCSDCGAVYHRGHWQWSKPPAHARQARCTACQRILEGMPAGYISVKGQFAVTHHDELLSLIRHVEEHEKSEHPLQRIMSIERLGDDMMITTTDIHLARDIGEALQQAYKGELGFHYNKDDYLLLVHWRR
jgi:NMD protein affecting ribosome stability and mRNA decay